MFREAFWTRVHSLACKLWVWTFDKQQLAFAHHRYRYENFLNDYHHNLYPF